MYYLLSVIVLDASRITPLFCSMSSGVKPHNFKMNCDSSKYISSLSSTCYYSEIRSVSGNNNRLVKFASQIFLIFLILVNCENKATSASFLRQKIHPPLRFPSLFLSSLVICINPTFTKMIDGTEKPRRDTTDFAVKGPLKNFPF